jgi:hypothetical protein
MNIEPPPADFNLSLGALDKQSLNENQIGLVFQEIFS